LAYRGRSFIVPGDIAPRFYNQLAAMHATIMISERADVVRGVRAWRVPQRPRNIGCALRAHRDPCEYSVPGAALDHVPQDERVSV
jgi:hypothetical protein